MALLVVIFPDPTSMVAPATWGWVGGWTIREKIRRIEQDLSTIVRDIVFMAEE